MHFCETTFFVLFFISASLGGIAPQRIATGSTSQRLTTGGAPFWIKSTLQLGNGDLSSPAIENFTTIYTSDRLQNGRRSISGVHLPDERFPCPEPVMLIRNERYPKMNEIINEGLTIEKTFHIELELFLTASNKASDWTNLFHFTLGRNHGTPGDRIPGLWFHARQNSVHFVFYRNGNPNYVCDSRILPINEWHKFEFSQYKLNGKYWIKLLLNGEKIGKCPEVMENTTPKKFENVKVYMSDPWYQASAIGKIRNLKLWNSAEDINPEKCDLSIPVVCAKPIMMQEIERFPGRNLRIYDHLTIDKTFHIEFEMMPTRKNSARDWTNLLHFTISGNHGSAGDRTPGLWFIKETTKIHFAFFRDGNVNYVCNSKPLAIGQWSKLEFSQYYEEPNGRFWVELRLNGEGVGDCPVIMENTTPKKFENVKVFLGDPWHEASSFAKVRGLKFWSSPEDTHPSKCKNEIEGRRPNFPNSPEYGVLSPWSPWSKCRAPTRDLIEESHNFNEKTEIFCPPPLVRYRFRECRDTNPCMERPAGYFVKCKGENVEIQDCGNEANEEHGDSKEKAWFFNSEYKDSFGVSYQGIVDFCASKKMRLCTFDEYCPNGRLNKPDEDFKIPYYADAYAPFYNPNGQNENNWLQIGFWKYEHTEHHKFYNKQCWINPWGKPWGLTNTHAHTKPGVCCAPDNK